MLFGAALYGASFTGYAVFSEANARVLLEGINGYCVDYDGNAGDSLGVTSRFVSSRAVLFVGEREIGSKDDMCEDASVLLEAVCVRRSGDVGVTFVRKVCESSCFSGRCE